MQNLVIEEIKKINDDMEELSELLKTVVNDGASIGFYLHWIKKNQRNIGKLF